MKITDFITQTLISRGITDIFGYPGGMVTHFMDSLSKYSPQISAHLCYHEQSAAFAACGYAQANPRSVGVAYATSGPGATNLVTGIANAYFDSIPTLFITGQVNTYEGKGALKSRQKGFQETDIIAMVRDITKYAAYVGEPSEIRCELEKALHIASSGRPGPVLLDIPMDVQRTEVAVENLRGFTPENPDEAGHNRAQETATAIQAALQSAKRPCILIGAGIHLSGAGGQIREWLAGLKIPVVSSMLAIDCGCACEGCYFGFIGAYGHRTANYITAKCDLLISLGSRLDLRQTGANTAGFAPNAQLIRVDVDADELTNVIRPDESSFATDLRDLLPLLVKQNTYADYSDWIQTCNEIRSKLKDSDPCACGEFVREISNFVHENAVICTDVGQNQVWVAQNFASKQGQRILFSGGHGAMGYSLPAAIGAYYARGEFRGKPVYSFNGDGGFQMNSQELQFLAREQIPVKVIIMNNSSLGMIRHFQEMYFESDYAQTVSSRGYTAPDFSKLASAYALDFARISSLAEIADCADLLTNSRPAMIEVALSDTTYVFPKLHFRKPLPHQEPELDADLSAYLEGL
jgi:acetolactate synthase-1/2/3 large subunit